MHNGYMSEEINVYGDAYIIITSQKIQVASNTYFIRNISSVGISAISPNNNYLAFLAILFIMIGLFTVNFGQYPIGVFLLLLAALFIFLKVRSKNTYVLQLVTNAGQLNTIFSKDYQYIESLKDCVERAICIRA